MVQEFYGNEIWADILKNDNLKTINLKKEVPDNYTIIVDDWRRPTESDYLLNSEFNIIKVYLSKEGVKQKPSKGSSHYEGLIKPEDCDIVFTYNEDYSNFEEIIGLIQNAIK